MHWIPQIMLLGLPLLEDETSKVKMYISYVWHGAFHITGVQDMLVEFSIPEVLQNSGEY